MAAAVKPFGVLYYATPGGAGYPEANKRADFAVRDIMSESPIEWVNSNQMCSVAAARMEERNVGILPVKDPATSYLVGVITDRDLIVRVVAKSLDPATVAIGSVMSGPVVALVYDDSDLMAAERLMIDRGVRRLLVIRRSDNGVVGILSVDDFAMAGFRRRAGEIIRGAAPGTNPLSSDTGAPVIAPAGATQPSVNAPDVSPSVYTVFDVMTGLVECACKFDTCREVSIKMAERSIGCLPICTEDHPRKLIGLVTDRDIVTRILARGLWAETVPVQEAMTKDVACCYSDHNLADAERIMIEKSVRRLPVLKRETQELIGMLSVDDIALAASRSRAGRVLENAAQFANVDEGAEKKEKERTYRAPTETVRSSLNAPGSGAATATS